MTPLERSLLRERVQVLVLRYALESALERIGGLAGSDAEKVLAQLEHSIAMRASVLPDRAMQAKLTVLGAVEDALASVHTAFGNAHDRLERAESVAALAA